MRLTGVDSSFPNPAAPRRRCRHKSLTDRLKPSDASCRNCATWTDTSAALLRSASERFAVFMVEENLGTIYSCTPAKRSQFFSIYPMTCKMRSTGGDHREGAHSANGKVSKPSARGAALVCVPARYDPG